MVIFYALIFSLFAAFNPTLLLSMQEQKPAVHADQLVVQLKAAQLPDVEPEICEFDLARKQARELIETSPSLQDALVEFVNSIKVNPEEIQKLLNVLFLRELIIETSIATFCEYQAQQKGKMLNSAGWDKKLFYFLEQEQTLSEQLSLNAQAFLKEFDKYLKQTDRGISFSKFKQYANTRKEIQFESTKFIDEILKIFSVQETIFKSGILGFEHHESTPEKEQIIADFFNKFLTLKRCASDEVKLALNELMQKYSQVEMSFIGSDIDCDIQQGVIESIREIIYDALITIDPKGIFHKNSLKIYLGEIKDYFGLINFTTNNRLRLKIYSNIIAKQYATIDFLLQNFKEFRIKINKIMTTQLFDSFLAANKFRSCYARFYELLYAENNPNYSVLFDISRFPIGYTQEKVELLPSSIFKVYSYLSSTNYQDRKAAQQLLQFHIQKAEEIFNVLVLLHQKNDKNVFALSNQQKTKIKDFLQIKSECNLEINTLIAELNLPCCYGSSLKLYRAFGIPLYILAPNCDPFLESKMHATKKETDYAQAGLEKIIYPDPVLAPMVEFYHRYAQQFPMTRKNRNRARKKKSAVPLSSQETANKKEDFKEQPAQTAEAASQDQTQLNEQNKGPSKKKKPARSQAIPLSILHSLFNFDSFNIAQDANHAVLHHQSRNGHQKIALYFDEANNEASTNLAVKRCQCPACGGKIKADRYHDIPSAIQNNLNCAYKLTQNSLNNPGIHHQFYSRLHLAENEFALVLEARIINNPYFPSSKVLDVKDMLIKGHHHGAYVFIYNQDGHCKHAMFHETIASAQANQ